MTVETLERATLAAVPPETSAELPGWVLPLDTGTVSRARSAVPLSHEPPDLSVIDGIESIYRDHGLIPRFRLPVGLTAFSPFETALRGRGYKTVAPVLVMVGTPIGLRDGGDPGPARLDPRPSDAWVQAYLGEGFDPVDGAIRVGLLTRSADTLYASISPSQNPDPSRSVAAVGCACFADGVVGVHGMRTVAPERRRGHARALLAAMGVEAARRGIDIAYLQVEVGNAPARRLYDSLGFTTAWTYDYWVAPA